MRVIVQCPYCAEGESFKVMAGNPDGHSFVCARCFHVCLADQPLYEGRCAHCNELYETAAVAGLAGS
jgi:hypothetical protein